ncbi:IS3 family transposase [Streptomyces atratus]|uniref:IS3 family transposase n=1 Tax=Streptomyces atratus TaxID=1893 RepID=UPI0037B365A9
MTGATSGSRSGAQRSVYKHFKTELIKPRRSWETLFQVELTPAEWVGWFNHHRLHGEIGYVPPVEYEAT